MSDNGVRLAVMVAMDRNRVIGRNNRLPWHLPEDLRHFKEITMGKPMVMGRRTFESIGRPLPGRTSIVVTRQPEWRHEGVLVAGSLDEALVLARRELGDNGDEIMVIGGAEIYRQALARAHRLYVTEVGLTVEGDTWFPEISGQRWREKSRVRGRSDKADLDYSFVVYECVDEPGDPVT